MAAFSADRINSVGEAAPKIDIDLASVLNGMAIAIFVVDARGELVNINDAALQMIGARSIDEVRSKSRPFKFPTVRLEDGKPITRDGSPLIRALAGETVVDELEFVEGASEKKTVLRVRAAPLRSKAGAVLGAVKFAVDVTREYELARVKDDFVRTAAHELKTPLAVIKANAEAALEALQREAGPARRFLEGLSRGIERVDRLINSLLDLLDIQGGLWPVARAPMRLDELVDRAISKLPRSAAARVRVIATTPIVVQGDDARLMRAVYAILDNAFKYSTNATPVDVSVRRGADSAIISILDRGLGIPLDKQSRIFEKYFRAHAGKKEDAGGIGVGLFVAREIVVQHGGRVWFESVENQGTTFFIEIPALREREA